MSKELYPGYIVKADGKTGRITAVNINSVVVQLENYKKTFKREDIEVLEAIKDSNVKSYKIDEIQYCEDCGKPKPIEEFSRLKGNKRRKHCKQCFGKRISKGHQANKEPKAKPVTKARPTVKEVPTVKEIEEVKEIEKVKEMPTPERQEVNDMTEPEKHNAVDKPQHYIGEEGLEVITVMRNYLPKYEDGYVAGMVKDVIKYILRAPSKGDLVLDLKKAQKYLSFAIEYTEGKEND